MLLTPPLASGGVDKIILICYTVYRKLVIEPSFLNTKIKTKMKIWRQNTIFILEIILLSLFLMPLNMQAQAVSKIMDFDGDGLSDYDETNIYHSNPLLADTDGDGYNDGIEIANNYSPLYNHQTKLSDVDTDNDDLNDAWEIIIGSDLTNADTDEDGYTDGMEVNNGYNPTSPNAEKIAKRIDVDLDSQTLSYYFDDKMLESFKISSGVASMPTPKGEFTVLDKVPSKNYGGSGFNFYYPDTKWNLHFTTRYWRYYIHGAYWHDNFGQPMSHGCINVAYENMERLYEFAEVGTTVNIFDSTL